MRHQQLLLDEEPTTVNTHRGLFQYNRLPFGVSSAPAIFQRTMDSLLQGLSHVTAALDDILITDLYYRESGESAGSRRRKTGVGGLAVKCFHDTAVYTFATGSARRG